MNREIGGHITQDCAVFEDQFAVLIGDVTGFVGIVDECFKICFGKPKYLSKFAENGVVLESIVCAEEADMLLCAFVVLAKDVIDHFIAIFPREIKVKIWGIFAVEIDESLKIKIEFDRIYVRDTEAISDDAIGSRASSDMIEILVLRKGNDVIIDQKIGHKTLLLYQFELFFDALGDERTQLWIAVDCFFESFLPEKIIVFPVRT